MALMAGRPSRNPLCSKTEINRLITRKNFSETDAADIRVQRSSFNGPRVTTAIRLGTCTYWDARLLHLAACYTLCCDFGFSACLMVRGVNLRSCSAKLQVTVTSHAAGLPSLNDHDRLHIRVLSMLFNPPTACLSHGIYTGCSKINGPPNLFL